MGNCVRALNADLEERGTKVSRPAEATLETIDRFNEALNNQDTDAVIALMAEDCVFEGTGAPDGVR